MATERTQQHYDLYRGSRIGECLLETIDELVRDGRIEPQLAMKILVNFDRIIAEVLSQDVKARLTFKGDLKDYNSYDDVWTFWVRNVKFKTDTNDEFTAEKVKIISYNAKRARET